MVNFAGSNAPVPALLNPVVDGQDNDVVWNAGFDVIPKQDMGFGTMRPCRAAGHRVHVHEVAIPCPALDSQHARRRAPTRTEDRANHEGLSVPPRPADEQRRERQDDTGEAGGQVRQEASVSREAFRLSINDASSSCAFRGLPKWSKPT
jgi:hypothetical protein